MKQCESTRLEASGCSRVSEARLSTTDPFLFDADDAQAFERVRTNLGNYIWVTEAPRF